MPTSELWHRGRPRPEPVAATSNESPSRQMETVVLEIKDSRDKELWISRRTRPACSVLSGLQFSFNDLEHPGFSDKSMGDAINAKS